MSSKLFRSKNPHHSGKLKFNVPEVSSFKLENGLPVYFVQKSTLPFLTINLVVDAGSKYDPPGKKGLSNLLAMVIDEGAGNYDSLELSDQFEFLGASFSISCDQDSIYFSLQILKDEFEKGLELFTTIVTDPHLDENDFNREKRKIKTRIIQKKDDADEIANEVFEYRLFGGSNSYSAPSIGYEEDINSIDAQSVRDYYQNILAPSRSFLVVVGDYNKEFLKKILNKHFLNWKTEASHKPHLLFNKAGMPGIYVVDRKDSVQSEIRTGLISYKRNQYDFYSRNILNLILGGQFSSRLNLNLREKRGFTYGVYSRFIYLKSSAYFFVSTSVSSENTGASLAEILGEIEGIKKTVTKKELEFAKSSLIRKFPSGFESYRHIALNIIGQIIHSLPRDYFQRYLDETREVTLERVLKAAQENLHTEKLTTVIVGNKEKIMEQLKDIYEGRITELDEKGRELLSD